MTKAELIENLGTIAHSGSKRFLEQLQAAGGGADKSELIGQFGVGFYSAFLVADRVTVETRAAGSDEAWRWSSEAKETYEIEPMAELPGRGTRVTLYLKDDQGEFTGEWKIRDLVERYSDYVSHPIELLTEREEEVPSSDGSDAEKDDAEKTTKKVSAYQKINRGTALWKRLRSDVEKEQYDEFYRHLTRDFEPPIGHTHFKIEGTQLFSGLLFIPKRQPFDLFDRNKRRGVRLYVRRVFIMDDCAELLPEWLRFVRGIIDSDDLPLNVSREMLQSDRIVRTIKKQVVKKTLDLLEEMAKERAEDYETFWKSFGAVLKEGLHLDFENRERIAKLCRFGSSKARLTSLADYKERMPEGQTAIYYLIGESRAQVEGSPHAEALTKRGFEVLYLTDAVDEWAVEGLREFDGTRLVSAMKAELDLEETDDEKKAHEKRKGELESLLTCLESLLKDEVKEVRISKRLTDSPCCLVIPEGGLHAHMERLLRAHDRDVPAVKRVFEVNPDHPIIRSLQRLHAQDPKSDRIEAWARLLHDHALITEGSPLKDPQGFARRLSALLQEVATKVAPPAETPTEALAEAPAETPVETPTEAPVETPTEALAETPATEGAPVESKAEEAPAAEASLDTDAAPDASSDGATEEG